MQNETYNVPENVPETANEAEITCQANTSNVDADWDPNTPFHGTQEEWWDHFHEIEQGEFMTLDEFDRKFETWKKEYLAKRLR